MNVCLKDFCLLVIPFAFLSCSSSFDSEIVKDPNFASGIEYGTKETIKPEILKFGDYTFVIGNSGNESTLGGFYNDQEFLFRTGSDGVFDTVYQANFNSDGIPDFLVELNMEYSNLTALISIDKNSFKEVEVGDFSFGDFHCTPGKDTLDNLQLIQVIDIDKNRKDEVLINASWINKKLVRNQCTDTIYVSLN